MDDIKVYTIADVSKITEYPPHVIRFYEKEFDLTIPRSKSNRRYFTYKEIEIFSYIKSLQQRGLTNNQIKAVLSSPEVIINNEDENRLSIEKKSPGILDNQNDISKVILTMTADIKNEIREQIAASLEIHGNKIEGVHNNVKELTDEIRAKDKDVLLCENAKLKMQLKQKAYEVAELKEKLSRLNNKKSLWVKIFK